MKFAAVILALVLAVVGRLVWTSQTSGFPSTHTSATTATRTLTFTPTWPTLSTITQTASASTTAVPTSTATSTPIPAMGCNVRHADIDTEEQVLLYLVNAYRVGHGHEPLTANDALNRAAAWKAGDMGVHKYVAHDDIGRTWVERFVACGTAFDTAIGENIASGYETAQQAFDAWRASPAHDANMLSDTFVSIGIGRVFVPGSPFGWYWTTDFAGE